MSALEPKPPNCVGCEYKSHCTSDPNKVVYCPDPQYRKWLDNPQILTLLQQKIEEPRKQVRREEIDFLVTEATKVWSGRIGEAKKQALKEVGEWLLGEYEATPQDKRIALFETVIEKLIAGQALKEGE